MGRMIMGAVAAAIAMFIIGFIFFGPVGLHNLAMASIDDPQAAAVQQSLAANLPKTGTYSVPGMNTPAQTNMFSRGPIATIHYNSGGFAATDSASLITGFVFNIVIALLIGLALLGIDGRVKDFGSKARVAVIIAVAASAFAHLAEPIYWHHDWPHFIYLFVADGLMLAVAGLILARFLTRTEAVPVAAEAPPEEEPGPVEPG